MIAVVVSAVLVAVLGPAAAGYAPSYVVEGRSMSPTLESGQRILVDPLAGDYVPVRLDVVVARPEPTSPLVVKRVVGVPGDRVRMSGGRVGVRPLDSDRWSAQAVPGTDDPWDRTPRLRCAADGRGGTAAPAVVPEGHVWLLGDNLALSDDSRAYGFVAVGAIEGPVWLRTSPIGTAADLVAAARLIP